MNKIQLLTLTNLPSAKVFNHIDDLQMILIFATGLCLLLIGIICWSVLDKNNREEVGLSDTIHFFKHHKRRRNAIFLLMIIAFASLVGLVILNKIPHYSATQMSYDQYKACYSSKKVAVKRYNNDNGKVTVLTKSNKVIEFNSENGNSYTEKTSIKQNHQRAKFTVHTLKSQYKAYKLPKHLYHVEVIKPIGLNNYGKGTKINRSPFKETQNQAQN